MLHFWNFQLKFYFFFQKTDFLKAAESKKSTGGHKISKMDVYSLNETGEHHGPQN
jgi:hypothetical protein